MVDVLQLFPFFVLLVDSFGIFTESCLEQVAGYAPATVRWQRTEFLLHYTCLFFLEIHPEGATAWQTFHTVHSWILVQPM